MNLGHQRQSRKFITENFLFLYFLAQFFEKLFKKNQNIFLTNQIPDVVCAHKKTTPKIAVKVIPRANLSSFVIL